MLTAVLGLGASRPSEFKLPQPPLATLHPLGADIGFTRCTWSEPPGSGERCTFGFVRTKKGDNTDRQTFLGMGDLGEW
jgi:hypothetical protein